MYELSTLDNGLRVLTVTMPYLQSVSMGLLVGVGSRYEDEAQAGASHFIEHMLFKGTPRRPSARHIAEAIEGKGGVFNASTGVETTLYWAKVAAPHLSEALDVMSDMFLNAAFDADDRRRNGPSSPRRSTMPSTRPTAWPIFWSTRCSGPTTPWAVMWLAPKKA